MVKRHAEYVISHGDDEFPVEGHLEPVDGSEIVKIGGNKAKVGWLVHDDDGVSGYYFDENDQGEFLNFDNRTIKSREMIEPEELIGLIRKNKGRVFWISKYEHGMVKYYRSSDALEAPNRHDRKKIQGPSTSPASSSVGYIPDQQWDVSRGVALYVAPDDCPDPAAYCDSTMQEFSDWCNGTIYGVVTQEYYKNEDEEWQPVGEDDACWGFIGTEHAENSLKEEMGG